MLENIRHKKISSINKKHIKKLHEIITEKSPYMANRVVAYLKMFFNHVLGASQDNPCKIPSKGFLADHAVICDYPDSDF